MRWFFMQKNREKVKILISAAGFLPRSFGGGESYVYSLAKELQRCQYQVFVLTPVKWNEGSRHLKIETYSHENINVITFSIDAKSLCHGERHTGSGEVTIDLLRKILRKYIPDVVHINGVKSALTITCNELNFPHVVTAHHMGIACPAGGLVRSDYSICDKPASYRDCVPCCSYWKAPKWYTGRLLGRIPPRMYRPIGKALNRVKNLSYLGRGLVYPWLIEELIESEKTLLSQAKYFIAPSHAVRELLTRNGCDPSKITVLPHGIEPLCSYPFEPFSGRLMRF
jgi:glycosyltransferase involved in cell wall biosynthesis